jgi:hypothetical protein
MNYYINIELKMDSFLTIMICHEMKYQNVKFVQTKPRTAAAWRVTLVLHNVIMVHIRETKWVNHQCSVMCVCLVVMQIAGVTSLFPPMTFLGLASGLISTGVETPSPR